MQSENIIDLFFENRKNANCVLKLEEDLLSDEEAQILSSIDTTEELFKRIFERRTMHESTNSGENVEKYTQWLRQRYSDFIGHFITHLSSANEEILDKSLRTLMTFVKLEGDHPLQAVKKGAWFFPKDLFEKLISTMLSHDVSLLPVISKFQHYLAFDDIKMYLLKALDRLMETSQEVTDIYLQNCFSLLMTFKYPKSFNQIEETSKTWLSQEGLDSPFSLQEKLICKLFSAVWLRFLKFQLPPELMRKCLVILHKHVIPHIKNPSLLTDFLTDSYNRGGLISLLALNGLFYLMQKYNVEYPDFYTKLYSLVDEKIVNGKYSARFFFLTDLFLSSTHLPSYVVASFAKRLSRISLVSTIDCSMRIIVLVCNLIIRHPTLSSLVHRTSTIDIKSDPYDHAVMDPASSKASDSSLWEIKTLQSHSNPDLSRKAKLIDHSLPTLELDLSKCLDVTLDELYTHERKRKFLDAPLAIEQPNFSNWGTLACCT